MTFMTIEYCQMQSNKIQNTVTFFLSFSVCVIICHRHSQPFVNSCQCPFLFALLQAFSLSSLFTFYHFPLCFLHHCCEISILHILFLSKIKMGINTKWFLIFFVLIFGSKICYCSVSYDKKSLIINGQRKILFSGSVHYPRSTPDVWLFFFFALFQFFFVVLGLTMDKMQMWEGIIQKAKDGGLDVIETYVFWNLHEPSPGNVLYSFFLF